MGFLKMNNKNWRRLCKGEIQVKQLEINLKEVYKNMAIENEVKKVKIISVDSEDEKYGICIGDLGEINALIGEGIIAVLMTTGQGKGCYFPMSDDQLEVIEP